MLSQTILLVLSYNFASNVAANVTKPRIDKLDDYSVYTTNFLRENGYSDENSLVLKSIFNSFGGIKTKKCVKDLNDTINGYHLKKAWAIAMYDASVKFPSGVEYGELFQFGNYDQCMEITKDFKVENTDISPQYCLADVEIPNYTLRYELTRHHTIKNSTLVHWGICVPASCSTFDIEHLLSQVSGYENVVVRSKYCTRQQKTLRVTTLDILYAVVILSFVSTAFLSTFFYAFFKSKTDGWIHQLLKSFSIIENIKKLGQPSSDESGLSSINGIKFIAMFFIVGGHSLVFMFGGPIQNLKFFEEQAQLIQNAILINSPLLVDTFLLLSGFLFSRILLLELDKRKGHVNFGLLYIFRYLRLTPAYLAVIGLYSTWLVKMGDGPLWQSRISLEQERCMKSWWKNLLYINNYYGNDDLCMFQSWYLAADTQMFILAPLILYPLWKFKRFGPYLLGIAASVSVIIPFIVTYTQNLDPTFLAYSDEISDLSANDYFIHTYGKTHMRATGYIAGLVVGYLVHIIKIKDITIPKRHRALLWIFSLVVGGYSMCSVTKFYYPDFQPDRLKNSMYAGLHRLGWSSAVSWILLACVVGYGKPLKKVLASRALAPFSRLTYCAFLTNGLVELYMAGNVRAPKYLSTINLLGETLSHVVLTFLAALILCLLFESPIHGMEKLVLRRVPALPRKKISDEEYNNTPPSPSTTPSTSEASS